MAKPPKPNSLSISGALHAVDLVASTGSFTTNPSVLTLINHHVLIEGAGIKRWFGQVIQGTTPNDTGITSWDFEVYCIRGGRNLSEAKAIGPQDVGPEGVTVTIISPTPNSMSSDPSIPIVVAID